MLLNTSLITLNNVLGYTECSILIIQWLKKIQFQKYYLLGMILTELQPENIPEPDTLRKSGCLKIMFKHDWF